MLTHLDILAVSQKSKLNILDPLWIRSTTRGGSGLGLAGWNLGLGLNRPWPRWPCEQGDWPKFCFRFHTILESCTCHVTRAEWTYWTGDVRETRDGRQSDLRQSLKDEQLRCKCIALEFRRCQTRHRQVYLLASYLPKLTNFGSSPRIRMYGIYVEERKTFKARLFAVIFFAQSASRLYNVELIRKESFSCFEPGRDD